MIIFDTNAVNELSPSSPRADIIRKLRRSGHHKVAVPWMVLEEMAAHQAKLYPVKYEAVLNTLAKLREILPWQVESTLEPLNLNRLMDHWRDAYSEIFEVIETSPEATRKALTREALALPPAKQAKDHSEGARDAAIWFSILEFLEANPNETVCFVTANTKDFGNGTDYKYPMDDDIRGMEHRITRLKDFNEVVSTYTKTVSGDAAKTAADELLKSPAVRAHVAQAALELREATGFPGMDDDDTAARWCGWLTAPDVELLTVSDVTGHEIAEDVWYTANARWLLYGASFFTSVTDLRSIACTWETKILFSTRSDDALTLLTSGEPEVPDTADPACVELLKELKQRANDSTGRIMQDWLLNVGNRKANEPFATSALADSLHLYTAPLRQQRTEHLRNLFAHRLVSPVDLTGLNRSLAEQALQNLNLTRARQWATFADHMPKLDLAGRQLPTGPIEPVAEQTDRPGNTEATVEVAENQMSFEDADTADETTGKSDEPDPGPEGDTKS